MENLGEYYTNEASSTLGFVGVIGNLAALITTVISFSIEGWVGKILKAIDAIALIPLIIQGLIDGWQGWFGVAAPGIFRDIIGVLAPISAILQGSKPTIAAMY